MDISSMNSSATQISVQPKTENSQRLTDSINPFTSQDNKPVNEKSSGIEAAQKTQEDANEKNIKSEYDFKDQSLSISSISKGSKIDTVV